MAVPAEVREHYLAGDRRADRELPARARRVGIDYQLLDTSEPLELALLSYLAVRGRRQ